MLNLIELRDTPASPAGFEGGAETAAAANADHGRRVVPLLLRRGSYPMHLLTRQTTLVDQVGGDTHRIETVALVHYRS